MSAPTDWGVPVGTATGPDGRFAYYATRAAPRVQMWQGARQVRDFFAYGSATGFGVNCAYTSEGKLLVMPAAGGGPHLKVFSLFGLLESESMRGDPNDRRGFVPVPVDVVRTVERVVEVHPPMLSAGAGFPVRVAFEGRRPAAYVRAAFDELARLLAPAGCRVTTERPDAAPPSYGQVCLDVPLGFVRGGGLWPGPRWDTQPATAFEVRAVYVTPLADPLLAACAGAHEVGHAFGLPDRESPGEVMHHSVGRSPRWRPDDLDTLRERVGGVS
jgi:hypothetical protein